jgi:hypothetical protein
MLSLDKADVFNAKSSVAGCTWPRLSPKSSPKRDFSYGNALVNWTREVLGIELMPWQQFLLREGCSRQNGKYRYRTVLTVVGRQNGKTLLAAIRILGGLCLFGEKFVLGTAQNRAISLETWNQAYEMAELAGLPLGTKRLSQGRRGSPGWGILQSSGSHHGWSQRLQWSGPHSDG